MTELILFGGTAEGRALGALLSKKRIAALVCVATPYGEALLPPADTVRVHTGRLDAAAMEALLRAQTPRLVIDATHPYAAEVSANIKAACENAGVRLLRLTRESADGGGVRFTGMEELLAWVNASGRTVFSALGAKQAAALTAIERFRERVWLRVLPDPQGLAACLAAGFPAGHIICMQGPFSKELNVAMFRAAGADILLTKESGAAGGFIEKLEAAQECGMTAAVLSRPGAPDGIGLRALMDRIEEGRL